MPKLRYERKPFHLHFCSIFSTSPSSISSPSPQATATASQSIITAPFPLLAVLPVVATAPPVDSPALAIDDPCRRLHRLLLLTVVASDCCCSTSTTLTPSSPPLETHQRFRRPRRRLLHHLRPLPTPLYRHTKDVLSVAFSNDNHHIVSASTPLRSSSSTGTPLISSSGTPPPLTLLLSTLSPLMTSSPSSTSPSPTSQSHRNLPPCRPHRTSPSSASSTSPTTSSFKPPSWAWFDSGNSCFDILGHHITISY